MATTEDLADVEVILMTRLDGLEQRLALADAERAELSAKLEEQQKQAEQAAEVFTSMGAMCQALAVACERLTAAS